MGWDSVVGNTTQHHVRRVLPGLYSFSEWVSFAVLSLGRLLPRARLVLWLLALADDLLLRTKRPSASTTTTCCSPFVCVMLTSPFVNYVLHLDRDTLP